MNSTGDPLEAADLHARVGKALTAFLAAQPPLPDEVEAELAPVMEATHDLLLHGGKRLRPAFAYWGYRGAGGTDSDEVVTAVAALELLHAGALVHDDVMDRSDTRRGRPSTHVRFARLHRGEGWLGDPQAFGTSAAVLLGDLCLMWADAMLHRCGLPADALLRAQPVYDEMRIELMAGQYLDLVEQALGGGSIERALRVARYKTAKYTVERPLHLGAALAGGDDQAVRTYSAYGVPLGEAFQLRDDVLGVFGDPAQTGKPAGDDLREGKRTALVAAALANAGPAQTALLRRHLGDPHLDDAGVAALRVVVTETGALDLVEGLIAQRAAAALHALEDAPLTGDARAALTRLAELATVRAD